MQSTLFYNGLEIEFTITAGSPGRLYGPPENCYPQEAPEFEIENVRISDWDEFADIYGAKVCASHESLIETILENEGNKIADAAFAQTAQDCQDDFDSPDVWDISADFY